MMQKIIIHNNDGDNYNNEDNEDNDDKDVNHSISTRERGDPRNVL